MLKTKGVYRAENDAHSTPIPVSLDRSFFFSSNSLSKVAEIRFCKYRFLSDNTQTPQAGIQSPTEFYHFHPFLSYMCLWEVPVTNARIFHTSYPPQSNFSALTQTIQTPWDACVPPPLTYECPSSLKPYFISLLQTFC